MSLQSAGKKQFPELNHGGPGQKEHDVKTNFQWVSLSLTSIKMQSIRIGASLLEYVLFHELLHDERAICHKFHSK